MNHARLARTFHHILKASLPAAAVATAACGGQSNEPPSSVISSGKGSSGTGQSGTTQSGTSQSGTSQTGTAQSGTTSGCSPLPPICCAPLPVAAAPDGGLVTDDAGYPTNCSDLCGEPASCYLADAGLVACRFAALQLACTGRRPSGLLDCHAAHSASLGHHFAETARLEQASIEAFRHLRRELVAYRAPRRLIRAAE